MEVSHLIAGALIACIALAVRGGNALLTRRFGRREIGFAGGVTMLAIPVALMWLTSHFVSNRSDYWFVAIAACTGLGFLVSTALLGKPCDSSEQLS